MTDTFVMEELSRHFVETIANKAGFYTQTSNKDFGIDLTVKKASYDAECKKFYPSGRGIDIQLKSVTEKYAFHYDRATPTFTYWLETKNYNHLVRRSQENGIIYPLYLILLVIPNDQNDWINHSDTELMLKKCAYWYNVEPGLSIVDANRKKTKVIIPKINKVTFQFFHDEFAKLD